MKYSNVYTVLLTLICLGLWGCKYEFPVQPQPRDPIPEGRAKFENFTVLGGSLTAGMMDGALYNRGQKTAYPNLLGSRLDSIFSENIYGIISIGADNGYNATTSSENDIKGKFELAFRTPESAYPARVSTAGEEIQSFRGVIDTVNNFSVPFLRSYQVKNRDSLAQNKYFNRFSEQANSKSLLAIALQKDPSLFLLSIGTGDIFPYILNGAAGRSDPPYSDIRENDATPVSLFRQSAESIVDYILNNSTADIILPTIIDPTDFFYFNTLEWYYSDLGGKVSEASSHYETFNNQVQEYNNSNPDRDSRPTLVFDRDGGNRFRAKVFVDDLLPYAEDNDGNTIPKYRQMTRKDMMLYSAEQLQYDSFAEGDKDFATIDPAPDKYVITEQELTVIRNLVQSYNEILRSIAERENRVLLLDLKTSIEVVLEGRKTFDGVRLNSGFRQNTLVSADGYYPNSTGHALLANQLLQLLNEQYNTNFKMFDVNDFKGNGMKNGF